MDTKVREKIVGIYKIESPSGAIYIGQSVNILKRWHDYSKVVNVFRQTKLFNSFNKYGPENHIFSIAYRFPNDVSSSVVCEYEKFFVNQLREAGFNMMNIREPGKKGSLSEETKRLISEKHKGRKMSPEAIRKMSAAKKGKVGNRLGSKCTPEQIEKMSKAMTGFKHSEETKRKISANNARHNKGKPHSAESKEKNRLAHLGKKMSQEQKNKISQSLKGKYKSPEHNKKVGDAIRAYHRNKKLLINRQPSFIFGS